MRALIVILSLSMVAFAGCAAPEDFAMPPQEAEPGAEPAPEPMAPEDRDAEPEQDPEPAEESVAREVPVVTSILTTPYTAPIAIVLAQHNGEYADVQLWAGPEGLWCHATPKDDPMGTPPGYLAEGTWSSCTLSYEGEDFTHYEANSLALDAGMMTEIPVEPFTWSMEFGRTLKNNTGTHDELLESMEQEVDPAPRVNSWDAAKSDRILYEWRHQYCDTVLGDYAIQMQFVATGKRGVTEMTIDLSGHHVRHITFAEASTHADYRFENDTLTVWSDWGASNRLDVTLDVAFEAQNPRLTILPSEDCPHAPFVEQVDVPYLATTRGVAGDWQLDRESAALVYVYSD